MNRILSVILALAMVASMLCVGASATYKDNVDVGTTDNATTTVDGVTYTVARTAATLKSLLTSSTPQKIILGKDISIGTANFGASTTITVTPGTVLEGNGYTIFAAASTYNRTAPLFQFVAGPNTTIRNVTFGKTTLPMKFSNAAFFTEGTTAKDHRVIWENVDFNLNSTFTAAVDEGSGAICCRPYSAHEFYGCDLNVTLTGTGLVGGWFGLSFADIYMNNCTTRGTINGTGFTGGVLGQHNFYEIRMINCINYATVTGSRGTGGFVGNLGTGGEKLFFEHCTNFGTITSTAGEGYSAMAGGFMGRFTSRQNCYFLACENHGTISSNGAAGGFAGRTHDYDHDGEFTLMYRFFDCLNTGKVTANTHAGGFMGAITPLITNALFENCANIGAVHAATANGYSGNIAGMLNDATLTNCYLMGNVTAVTSANAGVFAGTYANTYTAQTGTGGTKTGTAPVCSGCYSSKTFSYTGISRVSAVNKETVLGNMAAIYGYDFIAKDSSDTNGNPYQIATPRLRGMQIMQNTKVTSRKQDVRFIAVINSLDSYSKIGFDVRIIKGSGIIFDEARESTIVYKSINNYSSENGTMNAITAESLGGRYIFAFTIRNVPTDEEVIFELTPYAVSADGQKTYTGPARGITGFDGVYHEEAAILDGAQLSKYSIVYDASGNKGEKELAKHLANEIAITTGYTLPVYASNVAAGQNAAHKLTLAGGGTGTAAAITASNGNIALTGATAARLGDAVKYFIDQINTRLSKGSAVWSFGSVSVPLDDTFSVMSYNAAPRAQNYNGAGGHRYDALTDRIFDYLPDIVTLQEPDRAFIQDSRIMGRLCGITTSNGTTGVENGNGYYSIYWGKGRHDGYSGSTGGGDNSVSVILWAKDRYTFHQGGTFWLGSRTNYTTPSKIPESEYVRCATWVQLTDKYTGQKFVVVNTHLDFDAANATQINYLKYILEKGLQLTDPILITGDMNANPASTAISNIKTSSNYGGTYESLSDIARLKQVNHYWQEAMIDWIFATAGTVEGLFYRLGNEIMWYGKYNSDTGLKLNLPSDHPLCYAEMRFK